MFRIDEGGKRGPGRVVPFPSRGLAADVLSGCDNLEVVILQLGVDVLPTWQIEPASSPRGPRDEKDLFSAEIVQTNGASRPVGNGQIRRQPPLPETAADRLNFTEAPHARRRIRHDRLPHLACEPGQIEIRGAPQLLGDGNAEVGATGTLRLDLEVIQSRQITRANP